MHTQSVLSIGRATGALANTTKEQYTIRVGEDLAEIVDDNGDIIDYGTDAANLCKRLRSRSVLTSEDVLDILGV
jgi:hypothetical protein